MKCIPLVDDDENITTVMERILNRLGSQVMAARNGLERVEIVKNQDSLDMGLTDIRMAEMEGNGLARYIHNSPELRDAPEVAIRGYGDEVETDVGQVVMLKTLKVRDLARVIESDI